MQMYKSIHIFKINIQTDVYEKGHLINMEKGDTVIESIQYFVKRSIKSKLY